MSAKETWKGLLRRDTFRNLADSTSLVSIVRTRGDGILSMYFQCARKGFQSFSMFKPTRVSQRQPATASWYSRRFHNTPCLYFESDRGTQDVKPLRRNKVRMPTIDKILSPESSIRLFFPGVL